MQEDYEAYFNVINPNGEVKCYPLRQRSCKLWTIGRLKQCDIVLEAPQISRIHARVRRKTTTGCINYIIMDGSLATRSKAGIFYHSNRIDYLELTNGDLIRFPGNYTLEFGFRTGIIVNPFDTLY